MTSTNQKPRIALIIEGAYPYIVGGVSIWIHQLISNLPDFEFVLWNIVPEPDQPYKFKLPRNIVEVKELALSAKLKAGTRRRRASRQWKVIHEFHDHLEAGKVKGFSELYQAVAPDAPGGLSPENLLRDFQGWELITEKYNLNHPITPFVEYYWGWRAIHIPLFQMFHASIPEADLYHAVSTGYAGLLGAIAKTVKGKPFLLTEHGIYAKEREIEINQSELYRGYQKRMWKKNFRYLAKIAYGYADRIIALFRKNQDIQIQLGAPPEKCELIPNGIRVQEFLNLPRKPHRGLNVGFIGRMVPIKDVKNFIMAARIVKNRLPDARFYLIGPQDERDDYFRELQVLVENLELQEAIRFTGKVDVKEYFPILDVLCLSSIKEAQPLTVIEAMVAGVPVVATRVGDVPDILQEDGIVVPPKSPDRLAEGVVRFVTDSEFRRRAVARARERAVATYDLEKLIGTYRNLYLKYAATPREAPSWQV